MKDIFPYISPLIESQFPAFYKEEGENFIAFVKAYYEWLETENNVLWHTRRLLNSFDIDETSEDFIVYFKEQILKNVQFTTASNKRLFIKNALDFYRSKGTPRSIDLFFKLVYGKPAKINFPADSLFRLSDNSWKKPVYLEVSNSPYVKSYNGKQIRGLTTGATAFVESFTVRKINSNLLDQDGNSVQVSKLLNVFYITNLSADFETGEILIHDDIDNPELAPSVIGSATTLEILAGGANYKIGDIVQLKSADGISGKGIVRETEDASGQVSFEIIKGGWGYTTTPNIIIAPRTLQIANVSTINRTGLNPYNFFEHLEQPLANLHIIDADTNLSQALELNDTFKIYDDTTYKSDVKLIQQNVQSPFANGDLYISIISGDTAEQLQIDINADTDTSYQLRNSDDVVVANIESFIDKSAFSNIIGFKATSTLQIDDIVGSVLPIVGEKIEQKNTKRTWASGTVTKVVSSGFSAFIDIENFTGSLVRDISFSSGGITDGFNFVSQANLSTTNTSIDFTQFESGDLITITNTTDSNNSDTYTIRSVHGPQLLEVVEGWSGAGGIDSATVNITTNFRITGQTSGSNSHLTTYNYYVGLNEDSITSIASVDGDYGTGIGTNYVQGDVLIFTPTDGGSGAAAIVGSVGGGGEITSVTMVRNGIGYLSAPTVSVTSAAGDGADGGNLTAILGNPFDYQYKGTYVVSKDTNTSGYINLISTGSLASFLIASLDDEEEDIVVWTDIINGVNSFGQIYADIEDGVEISIDNDSEKYGFPKYPTANGGGSFPYSTSGSTPYEINGINDTSFSGPVLTRVDGGLSGFNDGETITITNAGTNNGNYTISGTPTPTSLTVTTTFNTATNSSATITRTGDVSFSGSTITKLSGGLDGFAAAQTIYISGTNLNNNTTIGYTVSGTPTATSLTVSGSPFTTEDNTPATIFTKVANPAFDIESMLISDQITVGSIAAITQSNPGEDYNIDPVVAVIEPDIYNFKKRDYDITTDVSAIGFLVGERVLFKIRKVFTADSDTIDQVNNRITLGTHPYANGTAVVYTTDLGAVPITGLSLGGTYYINNANGYAVGLSTSSGGTQLPLNPTNENFKHYLSPVNSEILAEIESIPDTNTLSVTRKSFTASVYPSGNTIITGEATGYTATALNFTDRDPITGLNAIIDSTTVTANGVVKSLDVYNSGFGYQPFSLVTFNRIGETEDLGTAVINLGKQGQGEGFYENKRSFISDTKKLHDGDYYQEFSYEIESAVPFEDYFEMLKKVLHVAGTKMFAANVLDSAIDTKMNSIKQFEREINFNPYSDLIIGSPNQLNINDHGFNTDDKVIYTYDQGNTAIGISGTVNITNITDNLGIGIISVTAAGHGFANGDQVIINNTNVYDGSFSIFNVTGNTFDYYTNKAPEGSDISFENTNQINSKTTNLGIFNAGQNIIITGSTNNDRTYQVVSSSIHRLVVTPDIVEEPANGRHLVRFLLETETSGTVRTGLYFNQELIINKIDNNTLSLNYANTSSIGFTVNGNYPNETGHNLRLIS